MSRSHVVAALAVSSLAIIITFQLIASFGLPQLSFLHLRFDGFESKNVPNQIPFNVQDIDEIHLDHGTRYLLGVGKADITG
ncbi:MAG: hypothetical protein Q9190_008110, partial [Brigantiaea leucoxantha]